jgi:hypothetical protein
MTPKEKAEELFKTYLIYFPEFYSVREYDYDEEKAKQCALIVVDELINCTLPSCEFGGVINNNTIEYWEEVKQEIKKL